MSGFSFSVSSVADIPVLETERLRLRAHRFEDFADCAAMWADPAVARFIGGKPLSEEEAWTKFLRYAGHWALLGFGYWAAEEKATGKFVGEVGFADYKRGIEPSLKGTPEVGWVLAPVFHGKGYATEAVRAVVGWSDRCFQESLVRQPTSFREHSKQPNGAREISRPPHFESQYFEGGRTACIIAPENIASIRVAEKCGYRQLQLTKYKEHEVLMFVREAESFAAHR
jgi:RimJ/RimL family protein N-acetyltransferase